MMITYLFRHPGTGHSIEALFGSIGRAVEQPPDVQIKQVYLPHISRGLRCVWQNLRYVQRLTGTVFHITGDVHYAALALPRSKTVLTIHDCSTLVRNRNRPIRYALFWLFWYYLPVWRAGVVTVVSEKTRQELVKYVGRVARKSVVVPNGVDPAFVHRPALFQTNHPVLLQVGTAPNKNLSRLITALEGITCTLLIVGPLSDITRNELRQRQIDYRHYANLSRAEVIQLYIDCDLVTFASTYEGFGMPVLEASAVGRVVLTSAIRPMRDLFPDAAHFVDPTDVTAIRQGVLQLINDGAYRQKLLDMASVNAQRYTITKAAARYQELYQWLVTNSVAPHPAP